VNAQNRGLEGLEISGRRFASPWWGAGSGSGMNKKSWIRIRIKVKSWSWILIRIRIHIKVMRICNPVLGLHEGRPIYRRLRREHPALQNIKFLWVILLSWIRIWMIKTNCGTTWIRISRHWWPIWRNNSELVNFAKLDLLPSNFRIRTNLEATHLRYPFRVFLRCSKCEGS
jgi:hypothetical protein